MLTRKRLISVLIILVLVSISGFLLSRKSPPETIITYKAVEFSPNPANESNSHVKPDSQTQLGVDFNQDSNLPESNNEASVVSKDSNDFIDELFLSEILEETEDNSFLEEDSELNDNDYPEVPVGFPFIVVWETPQEHLDQMPSELFEELELMGLVMIKLWNEGDQNFAGAFMSDGKVYPTYSDVAYVKWDKSGDSGEWTINEVITVDDSVSDQLLNGVFPPGVEIIDQDSAGINPHSFLSQ
ncbi:MAG: hypothetical protein OXH39_10690 [Candidatus Poribacteria bacterium]|nr:hypothetical protein [Candidatus Poribacteria bacterium]